MHERATLIETHELERREENQENQENEEIKKQQTARASRDCSRKNRNLHTAASERMLPRPKPQTPCPDVQPCESLVPAPTARPAI